MKDINLVINGIKIKSLSFKYVEFSIKLLIRNNCKDEMDTQYKLNVIDN